MSDYINRKQLIKALSDGWNVMDDQDFCNKGVWHIVQEFPAADVRSVVYCKDCVHFIRGELFGDMVCDYHYLHHYHAEPNEFCSHAEKREKS